jgi:hypothetical protein
VPSTVAIIRMRTRISTLMRMSLRMMEMRVRGRVKVRMIRMSTRKGMGCLKEPLIQYS